MSSFKGLIAASRVLLFVIVSSLTAATFVKGHRVQFTSSAARQLSIGKPHILFTCYWTEAAIGCCQLRIEGYTQIQRCELKHTCPAWYQMNCKGDSGASLITQVKLMSLPFFTNNSALPRIVALETRTIEKETCRIQQTSDKSQ